MDLLAGGVPCPPFSIAGKQLGSGDDRDLFPQALRLAEEISPRAVLQENVRGLATARFDGYCAQVLTRLADLGYMTWWDLVHASEHGVPQLRNSWPKTRAAERYRSRIGTVRDLASSRSAGQTAGHGHRIEFWSGTSPFSCRAAHPRR